MWLFGHLGLGSQISKPLGRKLPWGAILWGTLLPDLIDKPFFYAHKYYVQIQAASLGQTTYDLGLLSCGRTFGHTAVLILTVCAIAWLKHSRTFAGLALGMATHLLLDGVQDTLMGIPWKESSAALAALYPLSGRFAAMPFDSVGAHLASISSPVVLVAEFIGAFLLFREWRRRRYGLQKKYFASKKTAL